MRLPEKKEQLSIGVLLVLTFLLSTQIALSQIDPGYRYFIKQFSVTSSLTLELTDNSAQSLDVDHIYQVHLVTRGTGTKTGAEYLVWYDSGNSVWKTRVVSSNGTNGNHPLLIVDNNVVKVSTSHPNSYPVKAFVKELQTDEPDVVPHFYGASYQWQRKIDDLFYTDGNVGIGTTAPIYPLHVGSGDIVHFSGDTESTLRTGTDEENNLELNVGAESAYIDFFESDTSSMASHVLFIRNEAKGASPHRDIRFQTESENRMTIKANGNVGIGLIYPETQFHLYDENSTSRTSITDVLTLESESATDPGYNGFGTGIVFYGRTYQNATKRIQSRIASIQRGDVGNDLGNALLFETIATSAGSAAPVERMRIEYNGNVAIGTTDPGDYKLAVEGQVGARSIKVTQAAWADYVFAPSYQLMPLKQVEEYISQNQHLPNVPSAEEVEKNGFVLEEMDAKLMEKIEELTLYIIQQEKQSEKLYEIILSQNIRITQLEKEIDK